jgi:tyrosine-protein phosphatase YwqE
MIPDMATFDFIAHKGFRASLENDYREMEHCLNGEAWKSVQVLAGSMVEALLIDFIASTMEGKTKRIR